MARLVATGFARVGMSSLSVRILSWYIINESRIQLYSLLSVGATEFLHAATGLMLNNMDNVTMEDANPGKWLERKVGANKALQCLMPSRYIFSKYEHGVSCLESLKII